MKKLKMTAYIILAFTFILHNIACNRSAPAADIVVTTEKVILPEPTAVLMSAEEKAESLYNLLMENIPAMDITVICISTPNFILTARNTYSATR